MVVTRVSFSGKFVVELGEMGLECRLLHKIGKAVVKSGITKIARNIEPYQPEVGIYSQEETIDIASRRCSAKGLKREQPTYLVSSVGIDILTPGCGHAGQSMTHSPSAVPWTPLVSLP